VQSGFSEQPDFTVSERGLAPDARPNRGFEVRHELCEVAGAAGEGAYLLIYNRGDALLQFRKITLITPQTTSGSIPK
jgi:hypothetical protein